MLVRVLDSWLSYKKRKRNINQGYGVLFSQKPRKRKVSKGFGFVAFPEAAKEKC